MEGKELPGGWASEKIVEFLLPNNNGKPFQQGFSPKCHTHPADAENWGVLKTTAIQTNDFWPDENKALPEHIAVKPHLEVMEGDIVMTCAGPRSRCGVPCLVCKTRPKLLLSGKMYRFRTDPKVMNGRYLMHFLSTYEAQNAIDRMKTGINDSGLNLTHDRFAQLVVPAAPLPEQQRIVEKIETLFAELDKGEEALREVQKLLARYRQSVLKAAVTGTLTADWRAANGPPKESGLDLLDVVKAERVERGRRKQSMAPKIDQQLELPSSWAWSSLDELLYDGPTNGVSPKQADAGGTPSFKLTATTSGRFIINDDTVKQVNIQPEADSKFWLKAGDVLIQRGNTIEYVGTAATFPGPDNQYIYPDLMMRVRFTHEILAEWAVAWINFEYAKRHFRSLATGTAGNMPKINGTTLKSLAVPVPPLAEIGELLQRLDDNLSKVDPIAAWCETELKRSAALRQSILKDAFSGKLVPQDPSDEPADKLLERIRAARQDKPKTKRRKAKA